jgi:anti-sigma regulatory factor (Ser/Thr protein kinase)
LPKDPKAPLLARAFVRNSLCEKHSREARDEAELLVSELVTNAVMHGGSLVTMELDCEDPDGIWVAVSDSSPTWPVTRNPGPMEESGRGMALVDLISEEWGVREAGIASPPRARPSTPSTPSTGQAADGAEPADPDVPAQPVRPPAPASLMALLPRQAQGKTVWFRLKG